MILGFTGSRHSVTGAQLLWLDKQLMHATELHHGACVCADEYAHRAALATGRILITVHPPAKGRWMMPPDWNHPNVTVLPHKPYHERDRDIVDACQRLIALPNSLERPNSGTWYTINYAVSVGMPVAICYPLGEVETR